jgi:hypothetical protein
MAIPVISSTQSVLSVAQWQDFSFTAAATDSPTEWRISPVPPAGMTFSTNGLLKGPAILPGIFNFTLEAKNADGWSSPVQFTMACYYTDADNTKYQRSISIDVVTRAVTQSSALAAKYGDDLVLRVSFRAVNDVLNLDITSLKFGLKERDGDPVILTASQWRKVTTNLNGDAYYLMHIPISGAFLSAILADYEADAGTSFTGLAEIEWVARNAVNTVGPAFVRLSSNTFPFVITRDLIA